MKMLRFVAAGVAWLFLAAVVYQVFLAGVGVFGAGSMAQHRDFGYLIPLVALVLLIAVAIARTRGAILPAVLLVVLASVQTMLPWFRIDAPFVAALHPVNALVLALLGLVIARRATAFARESERAPEAQPASQSA